MANFRKPLSISLLCLVVCLLLFSGCNRNDRKNYLSQKRLGVYLKTEKGDRVILNESLTAYLREQLPDTEVITLAATDRDLDPKDPEASADEDQVDYILTVRLDHIKVKISPNLDMSENSLKLDIGRKCELTLSYRLTEAKSGKVVFRGQTQGNAADFNRSQLDERKININLSTQEEAVIELAMLNAIEASQLLKQ